jgi:hypothetical protein
LTKELKEFAEGLPEERRKNPDWYEALKKELDEHADRIEARLRRFYIRALIGFAVLGIACAVGLLGFSLVLQSYHRIGQEIQGQRFNALLQTCLDTNQRNNNVLTRIDDAVNQVPPGPRHDRAVKSAQPFKLIITAAVPFTRDCHAYARSRVKGK